MEIDPAYIAIALWFLLLSTCVGRYVYLNRKPRETGTPGPIRHRANFLDQFGTSATIQLHETPDGTVIGVEVFQSRDGATSSYNDRRYMATGVCRKGEDLAEKITVLLVNAKMDAAR